MNFKKWIEENRHLLKPPVNNKVVYQDTEFIVMIVGGPNLRRDYHINCSEEFFYQLEGNIELYIYNNENKKEVLKINEGDIYLLPPLIPHSPQRPKDSIGLVVERKRRVGELDGFRWYCDRCNKSLHEVKVDLKDIVKDLPRIFNEVESSLELSDCHFCRQK